MIVECAEKFDPDSTIYLVGSQAIDQTSVTSDIDILIISNIKEKLAKNLRKNLRRIKDFNFLDCKIVTRTDLLQYLNINYTYVFTMIDYGSLEYGKPFRINHSEDRVLQEERRICSIFNELQQRTEHKENFNVLAIEIFTLAKRCQHFLRMKYFTTSIKLKDVLGIYLEFLSGIYDSINDQSEIVTSFKFVYKVKSPRTPNYTVLLESLNYVNNQFKMLLKMESQVS